jgi:hypothetical protein
MSAPPAFGSKQAAWFVAGGLMTVYVGAACWGAAIQDTARDVFYALAIREGKWFPLEGPILGGAIHLGPLWFYLMAVPLFVHKSWLSVALFAALLGSLKFPLALWCGEKLVDRTFGVLWAVCLAIPGWPSIEQLIFFNPNAAATSVLLLLALAMKLREGQHRAGVYAAFGLAFAFALHVHPTTAIAGVLALPVLRRAWRAPRGIWIPAAAMVLGFAVPFIPYAISQLSTGFPDFRGATGYLRSQVSLDNAANAFEVVWSFAWRGPQVIAGYFWPIPESLALVLGLTLAVPAVASAGALRAGRGNTLVMFAACTAAMAAWIAVLRPTTPVYFVYALAPAWAGIVALGLWWMLSTRARWASLALIVAMVVAYLMVTIEFARMASSGEGSVSAHMLDIKLGASAPKDHDTWFPAHGRERLGKLLCSRRASIHGHLAYVVDRSVGVDALMACGDVLPIRLSGKASTEHWVGMSRSFWRALNVAPSCRIGSLGLAKADEVLAADDSLAIPDGRAYFPRVHGSAPPEMVEIAFEVPRDRAVLVTNILAGYEGMELKSVTVDGSLVVARGANDFSRLFAPPAGNPSVPARWKIELATSNRAGIDVVAMSTSKAGPAGDSPCLPRRP